MKTNDDIKWENAAELNHMLLQLDLSKNDRIVISKFLRIDNERNYNEKLEFLKKHLETIPNTELFIKNLQSLNKAMVNPDLEWKRYDPIEETPHSHFLHAAYVRIPPVLYLEDIYVGKPIPDIFYRKESLLSTKEITIGSLKTIYYIIQPFGYDFPDMIHDDGMKFRLLELWNPHYVHLSHRDSKYNGGPTPIMKDGKEYPMMNNKQYTELYKKYRANQMISNGK